MSNNVKNSTIYNIGDLVVVSRPQCLVRYKLGIISGCHGGYGSGVTYTVMILSDGRQFIIDKKVISDNIWPISHVVAIRNEVIDKYESLILNKYAYGLSLNKVSISNERIEKECMKLKNERDSILKELSTDNIEFVLSYINRFREQN